MSTPFVHVRYGRIFQRDLRREFEDMRDEALRDSAKILRLAEESSIRQRWYRTGTTLRSLEEEFGSEGEVKFYRLRPTATSEQGAPYPTFGEYGTGRRGARTGRPVPRGYRHGQRAGMEARRYSRIAVLAARPQVDDVFRQKVKELAGNLMR